MSDEGYSKETAHANSTSLFFSDSLRSRFTQDIHDAVGSSRISSEDGKWLQLLVGVSVEPNSDAPRPRADRLIIGDNSPDNAELAGALLISDPTPGVAPVFEYPDLRG